MSTICWACAGRIWRLAVFSPYQSRRLKQHLPTASLDAVYARAELLQIAPIFLSASNLKLNLKIQSQNMVF